MKQEINEGIIKGIQEYGISELMYFINEYKYKSKDYPYYYNNIKDRKNNNFRDNNKKDSPINCISYSHRKGYINYIDNPFHTLPSKIFRKKNQNIYTKPYYDPMKAVFTKKEMKEKQMDPIKRIKLNKHQSIINNIDLFYDKFDKNTIINSKELKHKLINMKSIIDIKINNYKNNVNKINIPNIQFNTQNKYFILPHYQLNNNYQSVDINKYNHQFNNRHLSQQQFNRIR